MIYATVLTSLVVAMGKCDSDRNELIQERAFYRKTATGGPGRMYKLRSHSCMKSFGQTAECAIIFSNSGLASFSYLIRCFHIRQHALLYSLCTAFPERR